MVLCYDEEFLPSNRTETVMRFQLLAPSVLLASAFACNVCGAGESLQVIPEAAPPPPPPIEDGQALEPDVTIIQKKDARIEEYRINNRLYMVKVTPFIGKPYYLLDKDGDGSMESRISSLTSEPAVPQWVILSW